MVLPRYMCISECLARGGRLKVPLSLERICLCGHTNTEGSELQPGGDSIPSGHLGVNLLSI
jgi:hypothetical protein